MSILLRFQGCKRFHLWSTRTAVHLKSAFSFELELRLSNKMNAWGEAVPFYFHWNWPFASIEDVGPSKELETTPLLFRIFSTFLSFSLPIHILFIFFFKFFRFDKYWFLLIWREKNFLQAFILKFENPPKAYNFIYTYIN